MTACGLGNAEYIACNKSPYKKLMTTAPTAIPPTATTTTPRSGEFSSDIYSGSPISHTDNNELKTTHFTSKTEPTLSLKTCPIPQYNEVRKNSSFTNLGRLSQLSLTLNVCERTNANGLLQEHGCTDLDIVEQDEYVDVTQDADIRCNGKDVHDCIAIQRIISILSFYSANYENFVELNKYLSVYQHKLINDFHHILDKHLNASNVSLVKSSMAFECIFAEIMKKGLFCNANKCAIYHRNFRVREQTQIECNDNKLCMFLDILDGIHCYFLHSVDTGYRSFDGIKCQTTINDNGYDAQMAKLQKYLSSKPVPKYKQCTVLSNDADAKKSENVSTLMEGYLRKESMYLKQLRQRYIVIKSNNVCLSYKDHNKMDLTETISLSEFDDIQICADHKCQFELFHSENDGKKRVFVADSMKDLDEWFEAFQIALNQRPKQRRFDYWSDKRSEPKYESIKEEVTSNRIYSISLKAFDAAYSKAKYLINHSAKIKNLSVYRGVTKAYNLHWDATPKIDHILALILWTDYRILAKEFLDYWNKVSKTICDEFWIWSRFLIEAVNAFGRRLKKSKVRSCYLSSSFLYVDSFKATFNAPTSMTTNLQIAMLNAPSISDGIIFELGNNEQKCTQKLRYFDCLFVSCFANEEERLFVQPSDEKYYFHMLSVRNLATNENYEKYMNAMYILQRLFVDGFDEKDEKKMMVDGEQMGLINDLIAMLKDYKKTCIEARLPEYVRCILFKWSESVTNVTFDSYANDKIVSAKIDVFDEHNQCLLQFDKLNVMFCKLKSIYFDAQICSDYVYLMRRIAQILAKINLICDSELDEIYIIHRNHNEIGQELKKNWSKYEGIINEKKWQIADVDNKAFCLSRDMTKNAAK